MLPAERLVGMADGAADLNSYSQRFAERLFAAHPEWRDLAGRDPVGFPKPGSLLLEVPSAIPGRAMMIRTYGNQVTVDFGPLPRGWHEHFGEWSGPNEAAVFDKALRFIDDLMADRVVIATRLLFGRAMWTEPVRVSRLRRPLFGQTEVCSWTGARDGTLGRR